MNKIRIILILIFIEIISCLISYAYAATSISFNVPEKVELNDEFSVSFNTFDNLYGFQANVTINYSNNTTESKKIVYLNDFKDFNSLSVSFKAEVAGNATISIDNIVATDSNGQRIDLVSNKKEYNIIISSNEVDLVIDDKDVDDSLITKLDIKKYNDFKYIIVNTMNNVSNVINDENFIDLENYSVKIFNVNNVEKKDDSKIGSKDKIIIYDKDKNAITKYNIIVQGDVSGNGEIKMYDAFTILRKVLKDEKIEGIDILIMDYSGDGKISLYDAFSYLRLALKN